MFRHHIRLLVLASLLAARADSIPGLFPTGVDPTGTPLAAGARDPHWELVESPDPTFPGPEAWVVQDGFPIPPWFPQSGSSRWIGPRPDAGDGANPGNYTYRFRFSLHDFEPASVVLTGQWSSDNAGVDIRLNGHSTGLVNDGDFSRFSPSFTLDQGFIDGLNTLEFVVNNAGDSPNPTGFRAELQASGDPVAPPGTPPSIVTHPLPLSISPGDPASFSVVARGARPLQFQWLFNNQSLARATNASFIIPVVSQDWVGNYSVIARNPWGSVTSHVARLSLGYQSDRTRQIEPPGPSSRRTGIVLSEIHHHPIARPDGRNPEFIELYNSSPFPQDLSGWRLSGEWEFTFPPNTTLASQARLVVAADPDLLRESPGVTQVVGGFSQRLNNAGGQIQLRSAANAVLLDLEYSDSHPWPVAADGLGPSLVLVRPSLGEANPSAWSFSSRAGGSPGLPEPDPDPAFDGIVINEILAHPQPGQTPFIELFNPAPFERPVGGFSLRSGTNPPITLAPSLTLPANGHLHLIIPTDFLSASGQVVALLSPDSAQVIDALACPGQLPGIPAGRFPDGAPTWSSLLQPTPGNRNASPLPSPVRISEIHFNPLSGRDDEEFIELHNPGSQSVDLSHWEFTRGIRFTFPPRSSLAPGAHLAIARNLATLRALHPDTPVDQLVGDFSGALANSGELLELSRPATRIFTNSSTGLVVTQEFLVPVESLAYHDGGRWPAAADGGGSSLELIDARATPHSPDAWAASDESRRAPWTRIEITGPVDLTHPSVPNADQLQVILLGEGEVLLDDVEVLLNDRNLIANPSFNSSLSGWTPQGTHRLSARSPNTGRNGSAALHLRASARGDHVANRIRTPLTQSIPPGSRVTLRAWARWISGHPEILLRLRNGGLEAVARLDLPPGSGTPGQPNSTALANAAPHIDDVRHLPVLPAAQQPIRILARLSDPDGLQSAEVRYRLDPQSSLAAVALRDDGLAGDERANDGTFTALIPGQPAGTLVAFHLVITDAATPSLTRRHPSDAPARECLVRVGEPASPGLLPDYRVWLTAANIQRWANREIMSNEDIDATFVFGGHRVIHNVGARYSGSSYTAGIYNSPVGNLCGYDITIPRDEPFLGDNRVLLDWPIRDSTALREPLMYWFLDQLGLPNMHRRHVHLFVNGQRRGAVYEDVQQPGSDTIEQWFPRDSEGSLWKTDCWNEFSDNGSRLDPCLLNTLEIFNSEGVRKVARYRWNWRPRAVRGSANDFSDLFNLIDVVNVPTSQLPVAVPTLVDVSNWMRTFAMNDLASFWDAFGNPNGKNTFLYKPRQGRWQLMSWDFDVGLGVFNDPPNAPLFEVNDPIVGRLYQSAPLVRHYWAALDEALDGFFNTGAGTGIDAFLDSRHTALVAARTGVSSPQPIKDWIQQRRSFLLGQLTRHRSVFAIRSNNGNDFSTNQPILRLTGSAPLRVASLRFNGVDWPVTWTSITNWSLQLPLRPGINPIEIAGFDRLGQPVPNALDRIQVTSTGEPPPTPPVFINEWMASNTGILADPADGQFDDWFELFNAGDLPVDLAGHSLTDDLTRPTRQVIPAGFILPPRGHLLVWADGQPEQTQAGTHLHTAFRLSRNGSDLALFDPIGRRIDAVRFGVQQPNVAEGRWGDGSNPPFFALAQPSPGFANSEPAPGTLQLILTTQSDPDRAFLDLQWIAFPGRTYRVEESQTPDSQSWIPLEPDVIPSTTQGMARIPIEPGIFPRLFRLRLLP